jgi:hypothetical protein
MNHDKRRTLALCLLVVMALGALAASAAQGQFMSDKEHTILSGKWTQPHVFTADTTGFGAIFCSTASFSGTSASKSAADQTITPTYSGCADSFGRIVDIDNSNLTYTLTANETMHVSGGMTLTVTSGGSVVCTVVIKSPQTDDGIVYDNLGGTKGVEITIEATNVISTTSGGVLNCGAGNGEHKAGTYEGESVITGKGTDGSAAAIWVS